MATLPKWLAQKHRAFADDAVVEAESKPEPPKDAAVPDRPPDVGNGTLGRNEKYEEGTRQPEFVGQATIAGQRYRIAGWVREKDGKRAFSLAFSRLDEPVAKAATTPPAAKPSQQQTRDWQRPGRDDDGSCPF
jgi:hypothetical protein